MNYYFLTIMVFHLKYVSPGSWVKPKLVPYSIPEHRELKITLGYNEDSYLNFTELTSKHKYASEQHTVITEDGYILTVFRILPKCSEARRYPVLLMHGVIDSSDLWIVAGPKSGLGYVLANACFDVWAVNHRGNHYSRRHVTLDPNTDAEYWDFTFDEHGKYDLPAAVDYVLRTSARPNLFYIGHSQGTTNFFIMNSLRPEYNDKIRLSIHLAPVAWLGNVASPLALIVAPAVEPIRAFIEATGFKELFAKDQILHSVIELLCQKFVDVCSTILSITSGYQHGSINSKTLTASFGHLLVGTSTKDLAHFGQLVLSQNFQRFDEGRLGNIKRYGASKPPLYNVSKISSPVVLINAQNDWLSTIKDVNILKSRLPNVVENYVVPEKYWSHNNHVWGIKAPTYLFPKILDYFSRYDTPRSEHA